MLQLGYTQYVAQGGDWGSIITRLIGRNYPEHIRGVHVNMAFFAPINLLKSPLRLFQALFTWPIWPQQAWQGLKNAQNYISDGNAYYRMHATRPQTVAYCLSDSPVALLGWIYEKLVHWTDDYPWTDDEVLTWVSIYWFSRAGPGASVRTYFESEHADPKYQGRPDDMKFWDYVPRQVKLGLTQFPKDIVGIPNALAHTLGNVVFSNWAPDGGHFAAYERPQYLADDLRKMFGKDGAAYGCVQDADGYGESKKTV
jgi:pimeloyl-ACP methyl ester carboxylesterase